MRTQKKNLALFVLVLFFFCCSNSESLALIAIDQNYNFNLRFNNPGARANAMGGAFIGLADDATAAYTNPAGLTILKESEISLEYKHSEYDNTQYDSNGRAYDFDEEGSGLSFISIVIPTQKATFAVYRHELINITNDYNLPRLRYEVETEIEAVTFGIGMGLELLSSRLSLGVAVGFTRLEYYYTSAVYLDESFNEPPYLRYQADDEDTDEHYTLSLLWSPINSLKIGLVYRQGPEFKTTFQTLFDSDTNGLFESSHLAKNTLNVPDVYGLGLSYQVISDLTVVADINYIKYSDLLKDFRFQSGETNFMDFKASDYKVEDRTEFHIGVEYVVDLGNNDFALRAGYFYKPEHRIKYEGTDENEKNIAREGTDDHIFSVGAGIAFGSVQLDAAASMGEFEQEYTVSFVYRFGER